MKILFASTPFTGHITPMIPLATAFRDRGDDVLWAVPGGRCASLAERGFAVRPSGAMGDLHPIPALLARLPHVAAMAPQDRPDHLFAEIFGLDRSTRTLADLLPVAREFGPDVIVRDCAEFASPIVAAVCRTPCVTHSFGPLLPPQRVAAGGAAVAPLWEQHGLTPRPYGGSYAELYLDIYPPSLQPRDRTYIGASQDLRTVAFADTAPSWPGNLPARNNKPLVYVTFGTVFNDLVPMRDVVAGVASLDVQVIVTVGPNNDPADLGPQPPNVSVARFIPQDSILPFCSAVVSQAGSGVFLGSIEAGVPQVCVPLGADQFLNAEAGVRAGIAVSVAATSGAVGDAVAHVLSEGSYSISTAQVRRELAAMPTPTAVATVLAERYAPTR